MKKSIALFIAIIMVIITTTLMILLPQVVPGPMDFAQKGIVIVAGFTGYFASTLYFLLYKGKL